ncbi:MAG: transmembrane 220 family protein [Granulosicoccus sp.]
MLLFIGVQFNDPDGPMWMAIYSVPAIWAGIAGLRAKWLMRALPRALLLLSMAAALVGTLYYWPRTTRWWSIDVWYETETAREGMGMMIIFIVLIIVWWSTRHPGQYPNKAT